MKKLPGLAAIAFLAAFAIQTPRWRPPLDTLALRDSPLDELKALAPSNPVELIPPSPVGKPVALKPERWFPDYSMGSSPSQDVPEFLWFEKTPIKTILRNSQRNHQLVFPGDFLVPALKAEEIGQLILQIEAAHSFPEATAILRLYVFSDFGNF